MLDTLSDDLVIEREFLTDSEWTSRKLVLSVAVVILRCPGLSPLSDDLLARAARSLEAARVLLETGFTSSPSGVRHVIFYCATADLAESGIERKSHRSAWSVFGRDIAYAGLVDPALHRWLRNAAEQRALGDYHPAPNVPVETVRETLRRARQFVAAIEALLADA